MRAYWSKLCGNNWGDMFTRFLFRRAGMRLQHVAPEHAELFAVGSIASAIPAGFEGHVFGTGMMHEHETADLSRARIWALRGELTLERTRCEERPILGDPGLLADRFTKPHRKLHRLGIVPHYTDAEEEQVRLWGQQDGVTVVDIQGGIRRVIEEIGQCQSIVSSSLHGLVIADALGIPNQWVKLSDRIAGEGFKFRDYYSVFGMDAEPWTEIAPPGEWKRPGIERIKMDLAWALEALVNEARARQRSQAV